MAKIVRIEPGRVIPNDEEPAAGPPRQIEVTVTPQPKTRAHRQMNNKAAALGKAQARQEQNVCAPRKQSESKRTARRKRDRDMYHTVVQSDLAAGRITAEQAKKRLTKRRGSDTSDK